MSLAAKLRKLIFGEAEVRAFRDAIHDNRNAMQTSSGAARLSKKTSDEALRIAQCAINLLERSRDKDGTK